jgi:hypothetical protein
MPPTRSIRSQKKEQGERTIPARGRSRGSAGYLDSPLPPGPGPTGARRYTESLRRNAEARIKVFDSHPISAMSSHGCQDDFLVCIVGHPRSGTTLIEQILSSHSDVIALGERTDFHRIASGLQARLKSRRRFPECCATMAPHHVSEVAQSVREQLRATAGQRLRVVTKLPADCWELGALRGVGRFAVSAFVFGRFAVSAFVFCLWLDIQLQAI